MSEQVSESPKVGDKRIHIRTGVPLYVVATFEHEGQALVVFSGTPPDPKKPRRCAGIMQTVPAKEWLEKTKPAP